MLSQPKFRPTADAAWSTVSKGFFSCFARCLTQYSRARFSKQCDATKTVINEGFRDRFNSSFIFTQSYRKPNVQHSHGLAALDRISAETSIKNFIAAMGKQPYSISPSQRDINAGIDSERLYYTPKDLDQGAVQVALTDDHVLYMIDVDYYANMEEWLWNGRPLLIYTFVPTHVGGSCMDGSFYIKDNRICASYNGGARYAHPVWNYNMDHFVIKGKFMSLMVKVDQVVSPLDPMRRVVCLTPTTWYYSIYNEKLFAEINTLKRMRYQFGDVNILVHQTIVDDKTKALVAIGHVGVPTSVSLRYDLFTGLCTRLRLDKHPNVSTVERYLNADKIQDAGILAPVIYNAFESGWFEYRYSKLNRVTLAGVARSAPHFQASRGLLNEDGDDIGVVVSRPVVLGRAVFPKKSSNNDGQAVFGRVESIANKVIPPQAVQKYAREFINAFKPSTCHPFSESDVIETQCRPLQKVRNEQNKNWLSAKFLVKAFMKKESYGKVTDPRNISTCPPAHTVRLSRFTYAAKEKFKEYPWFVPGKDPKEIADSVRMFVMGRDEVLETDYSRLDGTISEFLRNVERGVYLRLFGEKYRRELDGLLTDEYNCKAWTASGQTYNPLFSRLSGSPLTTDGNTLITAFVLYCAARRQSLIQAGEIMKIPGLTYGDDCVAGSVTMDNLVETARQIGLTLKCAKRVRGETVTFLARVFVNPWSTTTSVQDPERCLGKIHLSTLKDVDPAIVSVYKATGYLASDPLTPVLSNYCKLSLKQGPALTEKALRQIELTGEYNWWYTNFTNSWPQHANDYDTMVRVVADSLRISESEVMSLCEDIDRGDWTPISNELAVGIPSIVSNMHGDTTVFTQKEAPSPRPHPPTSVHSLPLTKYKARRIRRRGGSDRAVNKVGGDES